MEHSKTTDLDLQSEVLDLRPSFPVMEIEDRQTDLTDTSAQRMIFSGQQALEGLPEARPTTIRD